MPLDVKLFADLISELVAQEFDKRKSAPVEPYDDTVLMRLVEEQEAAIKEVPGLIDVLRDTVVKQQEQIEAMKTEMVEWKAAVPEMLKSTMDEGMPGAAKQFLDGAEDFWDGVKAEMGAMIPDGASAKDVGDYLLGSTEFRDRIEVNAKSAVTMMKADLTGEPGKDAEVNMSDLAEWLIGDELFIGMCKGEAGKDGQSVDTDAVTEAIWQKVSAELATVTKNLRDTASGSVDEVVARRIHSALEKIVDGWTVEGVKHPLADHVEKYIDLRVPSLLDVTARLMDNDHFLTMIQGKDGKDGPAGPPPSDLQVREAIKTIYNDIRADILKDVSLAKHLGPYEDGEQYAPGDEVSLNGSTYRAKCVTRQKPPGDEWVTVSKSKMGKRGEQGEKGDTGLPGRDAPRPVGGTYIPGEKLLLELSDGELVEIDIEKPEIEGEE